MDPEQFVFTFVDKLRAERTRLRFDNELSMRSLAEENCCIPSPTHDHIGTNQSKSTRSVGS